MDKLDRDRIVDRLHYADLAVRFVGQLDPRSLEDDEKTFLAACKAIEIVGEAAGHVSQGLRTQMSDVAWREAIAMRHRLVHGYRSIVSEIVVGTVRDDLPLLIASLRSALENDAQ